MTLSMAISLPPWGMPRLT
ncbi:hypothetical protein A6R68_13634 [Neotoma lepida]|uniref:Uncharacterized protein n=1 Tax=Neotoma lepida TaxID=56216 RepID=A0A1A6H0L4_NEOLE|nr:hypothetical protein A6R68_13634 [Neotoma lepida]